MKTAFRFSTIGLTLALISGLAASALAAPPNDAGFKARGMKELGRSTMTRSYAAPSWTTPQVTGRQAFSYNPQPAPVVTHQDPCGKAVTTAQAPQAQTQTRRSYSYQPGTVAAPTYRSYRAPSSKPAYLQPGFKAAGRY